MVEHEAKKEEIPISSSGGPHDELLAELAAQIERIADDLPDAVAGHDAAFGLHALLFKARAALRSQIAETKRQNIVARESWEFMRSQVDERDKRILVQRQALWDVYGLLGFDQDGIKTPESVTHPPLGDLLRQAATEFREQYDALLAEARAAAPDPLWQGETEYGGLTGPSFIEALTVSVPGGTRVALIRVAEAREGTDPIPASPQGDDQ